METQTLESESVSKNGQAPEWGQHANANTPPVTGRKLAAVMISVMLGLLLAALDQTVVGPALPKIIGDLQGFDYYTWVITGYLLTSTIAVPIFGKLSDIYGRKWFYLGGIGIFLVGSALSGLSANIGQLILYRAIQGVGAGILFGSAFAIVADLIPPANRGKWQGAFGAVFGLSSVIGPTIGGVLTDTSWLGWRWVFYVNVPIGLIAGAAIIAFFPHVSTAGVRRSIDWLGATLLTLCLVPLLLAFSLGGKSQPMKIPFFDQPIGDWEWNSPKILGLFLVSLVFLIAFLVVESRAKEPIIPFSLFKNSIYTVSVITVFFVGVGFFSAIVYIPLFIQAIQGDSALNSGNAVTPMTFAVIVASVISGQIVSRTGKYRVVGIVGVGLATIGTFLLYTMNMGTDRFTIILYMILIGLGMGVTFPLYTLVSQNAFPMRQVGAVTAGIQFFRSIGGTIGIAILGSLVNAQFHQGFPAEFTTKYEAYKATLPAQAAAFMPPASGILQGISNLDPQVLTSAGGQKTLKENFVKFGAPEDAANQLVGVVVDSLRPPLFSGIQFAFLVATIMLALGLISTSFLKEIPLRKTNDFSAMVGEGAPSGHSPPQDGREKVAVEAGKEMAGGGMPGATVLPAKGEPRLNGK